MSLYIFLRSDRWCGNTYRGRKRIVRHRGGGDLLTHAIEFRGCLLGGHAAGGDLQSRELVGARLSDVRVRNQDERNGK